MAVWFKGLFFLYSSFDWGSQRKVFKKSGGNVISVFRLLVCADLHSRMRVPPSRRTFLSDMVSKWQEICLLVVSMQVDVIVILGDIFHSLDGSGVPHSLVSILLRLFSKSLVPIFLIPGNHDIRLDDNLEHLMHRPFGVLVAAGTASGKVRLVTEKGLVYKGLRFCGSSKPMTIDTKVENYLMPDFGDDLPGVMLTHGALTFPGYKCWGPLSVKVSELEELNPSQVLHLNGHLHNQQAIYKGKRTVYLSPGALMRGYDVIGNLNQEVKVGYVEIDGRKVKAELLSLKSARPFSEVFKEEEIEGRKFTEEQFSGFVQMITENAEVGSLLGSVEDSIKGMNLDPGLCAKVLSYLSRAS